MLNRTKRREALMLPYHRRKDIAPTGLEEIEQALDLQELGWQARRDWGSVGGLHLSHPDWKCVSEVSVEFALSIEAMKSAAFTAGRIAGLEEAAGICAHQIEVRDDEEEAYLACNIENTIRTAAEEAKKENHHVPD